LKVRDDAAAIKATVFLSVPRIYNRIVDNVSATLAQMITD
jgi:long-subunit acyl-CoA synthetase (AMP-forming)